MADDGIVFPRFFKVFLSEMASESLVIPLSFIEHLHDPLPTTVKLQGSGERFWTVNMNRVNEAVCFTGGWPKFALENELQSGEFLCFVYDGHCVFEVTIFERFGSKKETQGVAEPIELSDSDSGSVEDEEETSTDDDDDEDICQSLYPLDDDYEIGTDAAVEEIVDVGALTNPYFETSKKNRIYELLIPAQVVRDNGLIFGDFVTYIDEEGPINGLRGKWADDRICYKGWDRICRRNRLKKHDKVVCELLHDQKRVHSVRVHVIRGAT